MPESSVEGVVQEDKPSPEEQLRSIMRLPPDRRPRDVLVLCKLIPQQLLNPGDGSRGRTSVVLQSVQQGLQELVPATEAEANHLDRASPNLTRLSVSLLKLIPSVLARCGSCCMENTDALLDQLDTLMRRALEYSSRVLELRRSLTTQLQELADRLERIEAEFPLGDAAPAAVPRKPAVDDEAAQWGYRRRVKTDIEAGWGSELYVKQDEGIRKLKQRAELLETCFEDAAACIEVVDNLEQLVPWFQQCVQELQQDNQTLVQDTQASLDQLRATCVDDHAVLLAAVNRAEMVVKSEHEEYMQWHHTCEEWLQWNQSLQEQKAAELDRLAGKYVSEKERLQETLETLRAERDAEIERALQHSKEFLADNDARQKETEERLASLLKSQDSEQKHLQQDLAELKAAREMKEQELGEDGVKRKTHFEKLQELLAEVRSTAFQRCDALEYTQRSASIASDLGAFVRDTVSGFRRAGNADHEALPRELKQWLQKVHHKGVEVGTSLLLGYARAMHLRELQSSDLEKAATSTAERIDFCLETGDPGLPMHHVWIEAVKKKLTAAADHIDQLSVSTERVLERLKPAEEWLRGNNVAYGHPGEVLRDRAEEWDRTDSAKRYQRALSYPDILSPRRRGDPRGALISKQVSMRRRSAGGSRRSIVVPETSIDAGEPLPSYGDVLAQASSPYNSPLRPATMQRPQPPPRRRVLALVGDAQIGDH
eukprot:Hpha_TRINITY_DN24448_c0_g1::TRINITY_DN24448_c0_g1_i1::g.165702::m.165702